MVVSIILLLVIYITGLTCPEHLVDIMTPFFVVTSALYILLTCVYLNRYRKTQLFCFEMIFGISFFMSTLSLPYVLSIIDDWHARIFVKNDIVQVKAYLICFIGYLCYMLGLVLNNQKPKYHCHNLIIDYKFTSHSVQIANFFTLLSIILFYAMGGSSLLTLYSNQGPDLSMRLGSWGEFMQYAMCFYTVSIMVNLLSEKVEKSSVMRFLRSLPILFYLNTALLVIPLVISGYRSNAVQLIIPMILMYSLVIKKLSFKKIALMLVGGYLVLFVIGMTRSGGHIEDSSFDSYAVIQDFVSANAANTFFVDYVDEHGSTGGGNMILKMAAIIPFMQSLIVAIFGRNSFPQDSSSVFTLTFYNHGEGGLGTSLIGDLYYSLGLIGTMALMFILGRIIYITNKKRGLYSILILLILTGNAIFAARVEYFYIVRFITYAVIFLYVVLRFGQPVKQHTKFLASS